MQTLPLPDYTVDVGENIFYIIASWRKAAKKAGWPAEEIEKILARVTSASSYDEAMDIIAENCNGY